MVKPAMPYLDIIADAADLAPDHPLAAYQVSGEYAMIVAGARAGVYDLKTMAFESTEGIIRAGMFTRCTHKRQSLINLGFRLHAYPYLLHSPILGLA